MLVVALAVSVVLTPSGLSEQDLIEGIRYREQLLGPLELRYTVETRFDQEGVEVYRRYKEFIAERLGELAPSQTLDAQAVTVGYHYLSDGRQFRLSSFGDVADAAESWRLSFDGKLYRTYVPSTRSGQILATYASTYEDPLELGFTVEGASLAELLASSSIDAVREVDLDGVACILLEASRPHQAAEGIDEARQLVRVWVDPRRGFAVLRAEFGGEVRRGSRWLREMPSSFFAVHGLAEIVPGLWFPTAGVMARNIHRYSAAMQMATTERDGVDAVELVRFVDKIIQVSEARVAKARADALAISWPPGTQVLNTLTDELFLVGDLETELLAASRRIKPDVGGGAAAAPRPVPPQRGLSLAELDPDRDCGLRALYLALAYLDLRPDWQRLEEMTQAEREGGVSLRLLRDVAEGYGAHALGLRLDGLDQMPEEIPVIVFLNGESAAAGGGHDHEGAGHFLLALRRGGEAVKLYDPLESEAGAAVTPAQLAGIWNGEVLMLSLRPLETPRRPLILPWIAALVGLTVGGVLWLQRGRRWRRAAGLLLAAALATPVGPLSAQARTPAADAPAIAFDETVVDLGRRGATSGVVKHRFRYRNAGRRDLEISSVQSSCECTAVWDHRKPVVVPPGEGRTLEVEIDPSGRFGKQRAVVAVHSNDPVHPVVNLELRLVVEQDVSVLPDRIELPPIGPGTEIAGEVEVHLLVDTDRPGADIARVAAVPRWVHAEVEAVPDRERSPEQDRRAAGLRERVWTIRLSGAPPADEPPGRLAGSVTVSFSAASGLRPVVVPLAAEIVGRVFATPDRILFGLVRREEGATRQVLIRTPGAGAIEVLRVESDVPGLQIERPRASGGGGDAPLVVARLTPGAAAGRLGGKLTVHTTHGPVVVPVSAVVE